MIIIVKNLLQSEYMNSYVFFIFKLLAFSNYSITYEIYIALKGNKENIETKHVSSYFLIQELKRNLLPIFQKFGSVICYLKVI